MAAGRDAQVEVEWRPWSLEVLPAGGQKLGDKSAGAPAKFVEDTAAKLTADRERRFRVAQRGCDWQFRGEDRAPATAQRLQRDAREQLLHHSLSPFLEQVLAKLGCAEAAANAAVERLSVPRATSGRSRAEVFAVSARLGGASPALGREQQLPARGASSSAPAGFAMKVGEKEQLRRELEQLLWAQGVLGADRAPRLLLPALEEVDGSAALAMELVRFAGGGGETHFSTLVDLLLLGTGRFALEDARASWAGTPLEHQALLAGASLGAPSPGDAAVRGIAQQVAEVLRKLVRASPVERPPLELPPMGAGSVGRALFELIPRLERCTLQARHSTASPLHPRVRALTEEWYARFFGPGSLASAVKLLERLAGLLGKLRSAEDQGASLLPRTWVPLVWSHGRFTAGHLLLRGGVETGLESCVTGWSGLEMTPLYSDLAVLLTSVAFETLRLPMVLDDLAALYAAPAETGAPVAAAVLAGHLRVSESTAARLLSALRPEAGADVGASSAEETGEDGGVERPLLGRFAAAVEAASGSAEGTDLAAGADAAWLLAFLRPDSRFVADVAAEAKKVSEALCEWTLPRRAVRQAGARVGVPPPPSRRGRGEAPVRSAQWAWQALREFREAAVAELPVMEGNVGELWPALWVLPCLRHSLDLLDAPDLPWPQKVWLIYHAARLSERLFDWLDGLNASQSFQISISAASA